MAAYTLSLRVVLLLAGIHSVCAAIFPAASVRIPSLATKLPAPATIDAEPSITPGPPHAELVKRVNPTAGAVSGYSYLGCWSDGSNRILTGNYYFDAQMKPELCRNLCALSTWSIFGIESGDTCYCANKIASYALSAGESECSVTCPGNSAILCGASWRLNIYSATGNVAPVPGPSGASG
jgi:WSC domain